MRLRSSALQIDATMPGLIESRRWAVSSGPAIEPLLTGWSYAVETTYQPGPLCRHGPAALWVTIALSSCMPSSRSTSPAPPADWATSPGEDEFAWPLSPAQSPGTTSPGPVPLICPHIGSASRSHCSGMSACQQVLPPRSRQCTSLGD